MLVPSLPRRNALQLIKRAARPLCTRPPALKRTLTTERRPQHGSRSTILAQSSWTKTLELRRYVTGLSSTSKSQSDADLPRIDIPQYKPDKNGNIYPPALNIYHAGVYRTTYLGYFRVCSVALWVYCTFMAGPSLLMDPAFSNLWALALYPASMLPAAMLSTPYVTSIDLVLPPSTRKSQIALENHITNPPPDLHLEVKAFRRVGLFPKAYPFFFDQLRRLPYKRFRTTNLEHVHKDIENASGKWARIVKNLMGRYVVQEQAKERAVARGLFPRIWRALPVEGEKQEQRDTSPRELRRASSVIAQGERVQRPSEHRSATGPPPKPKMPPKPTRE